MSFHVSRTESKSTFFWIIELKNSFKVIIKQQKKTNWCNQKTKMENFQIIRLNVKKTLGERNEFYFIIFNKLHRRYDDDDDDEFSGKFLGKKKIQMNHFCLICVCVFFLVKNF